MSTSASSPPSSATWPLTGRADCFGAGHAVKVSASECGWTDRDAGELSLLAMELCNNAVRHGGNGHVTFDVDARRAVLVVEDEGPGFPKWVLEQWEKGQLVEQGRPADAGRPGGLGAGLDVVRRLAHEVILENRPEGGARARAVRNRSSSTR